MAEQPGEKVGFWCWFCGLSVRTIATLQASAACAQAPYLKASACIIGMGMMFAGLVTDQEQIGVETGFHQIVLGGLLAALIHYYVHGTIFHLLVLLAGGDGSVAHSRQIYIYANLPGHLAYIAVAVLQLCLFAISQEAWVYEVVGFTWICSAILLMVFQIKIFLAGVLKVQNVRPLPGFIIFFVLPSIYSIYTVIDTFRSFSF